MLLFAVLTLASCSVEDIVSVDDNKTEKPQEPKGYSFSVNVGDLHTRVTYHDNIGNKDNPYNPNSDGSNKLTMDWRDGDELVAIRWTGDYDEYVTLKASVKEGEQAHTISFSAEDVAHFKSPLTPGERFVLVHGDFVLDPGHMTDGKPDPVIDFPTSQVTKTGYASHIHHGGVVEGKDLTFRNQDGTLENLRKHEYMVADCYVHKVGTDASGNVQVSLSGSETKANQDVYMSIAHTLLRLTLFLPDEDFDDGFDNDLIAVSIKEANMKNIFHRYFRMHPNEKGTTNYYKTSYNDNADKEENPYIRINLMDEENNKPGVSHKIENVFGSKTFNPKKPVSVAGTLDNKPGHYFTLYFSLPSRHMGVDGQAVSELYVTAFTRTHAYTTSHTYRLPDNAMQPAMVVPLNVSFVNNSSKLKVVTDPELGISFTPGFVYAKKVGNKWEYGVYDNQGKYAGMSHQTLDFGEYFTFGGIDPTNAAHRVGSDTYKPVVPTTFTDVASLVEVGGKTDLYHMLTKQEADRLMARFKAEVDTFGVFLGYYYYDDGNGNTKHKAPGSQNPAILQAAAAGSKKTVEDLKAMSASVGIYVGLSHQPKYEEQDDYFFLPNAKQMSDNTNNDNFPAIETGKDKDGNSICYFLPKDYIDLDATNKADSLKDKFSTIFKFSTWLRSEETNKFYRMQVWTTKNGKAIDEGSSTVVDYGSGGIARPIRAVVY